MDTGTAFKQVMKQIQEGFCAHSCGNQWSSLVRSVPFCIVAVIININRMFGEQAVAGIKAVWYEPNYYISSTL